VDSLEINPLHYETGCGLDGVPHPEFDLRAARAYEQVQPFKMPAI
jgi:hypothetical protein